MTEHKHVGNVEEAWKLADEITTTDYAEDTVATEKAGYKVYRSYTKYYEYICDLGNRLEVNLDNGKTVNIWIDELDSKGIVVKAAAKNGEVRTYRTYNEFIETYRFFMASGDKSQDEQDFEKIIKALKDLDVDGGYFEILRCGLKIGFTLKKW